MRSALGKCILILLGTLVVALPAEWYLRKNNTTNSKWVEDARTGLLLLKPNQTMVAENTCLRQEFTTNALGFNDQYHETRKPTGTFRIAVLGDSFTEGMLVPARKRFSNLLEDALNALPAPHPRYEVLNFGITTHGTLENILYFDSFARRFDPDLVINAFFTGNDLADDARSSRSIPALDESGGVKPKFRTLRERGRSLARRSRLVVLAWNRVLAFRQGRGVPVAASSTPHIPYDLAPYAAHLEPYWERAWDREEKILKTLALAVKKSGGQLLLVALPEGFRVHDTLRDELGSALEDPRQFDLEKPERALAAIATRQGYPFLPLLPYFSEQAARDPGLVVFPCDGHWNERGHRYAAEAIAAYLERNRQLIIPKGM